MSLLVVFFYLLASGIVFNTEASLPVNPSETTTQYVSCNTTKGLIGIEVYPKWAPRGAKRFIELVKDGFFSNIPLFRCVNDFIVQFGITDKPKHRHWQTETIKDDPNLNKGIKKHYISFAGNGPNSRSTNVFIAFRDNDFLGKSPWETPYGKLVRGASVMANWYCGYGDMKQGGNTEGIDADKLYAEGNKYLRRDFPLIDYIISCRVVSRNTTSVRSSSRVTKKLF